MSPNQNSARSSSFEPLALVGMACLFPGKAGNRGYWNTLLQGVDRIREIPPGRWRPEDHYNADPKAPDMVYARRGAFLDPVPFHPAEFGIAPNSLEATDTAQLLGMFVAREALRDAGYAATPDEPGRPFPRERTSVLVGVTSALELLIPLGARLDHPRWRRAMTEAGVPADRIDDALSRIGQSYPEWTEDSFPGLLGNVVAGRIAHRFDLGGTNCVVDAACASSLGALHLAAMELHAGRSDVVITGGVDTFSDVFMFACFSKTPALSKAGDARPFSADADGTILGEGIGLTVLKRLADAQRDGDRIIAVLKGLGSASDGRAGAIYAPRKEGQVRTIRRALEQSGFTPASIGLVEAHGTGTRAGDQVELAALLEVFGKPETGPWCALGSVKSQIGHAKGAAGAAGLLKAALALRHGVIPPTLKAQKPQAALLEPGSPFHLPSRARPWFRPVSGLPRRAGVSAFGFGGSNFHAVLEESPVACDSPAWDGSVQILALSADSPEALALQASAIPLLSDPSYSWYARESRRSFSPAAPCRLVAARGDETDAAFTASINAAVAALRSGASWHAAGGVRAANRPRKTRLALLFPGQGAQKSDSFRELACIFPELRLELERGRDALAVAFPSMPPLDNILYSSGYEVGPDSSPHDSTALLRDTRACQVGMAALGRGAAKVLARFGVGSGRDILAAGHSLGEWTALATAGLLPAATWYSLLARRAGLMHKEAETRPGAMLAVLASRDEASRLAHQVPGAALANHNGQKQSVLSGSVQAIDACQRLARESGLRAMRLDVGGAFHHPSLGDASRALAPVLREAEVAGHAHESIHPAMMVLANLDARPYLPGEPGWLERLHRQVSEPVLWVDCLDELRARGAEIFLEVGPGSILTRMAHDSQTGPAGCSLALEPDPGRPGELFRLAVTLAHLAALGLEVNLQAWEDGLPALAPAKAPPLVVPLSGANFRKPRVARPPLDPIVSASLTLQVVPTSSPSRPLHSSTPKPVAVPTPRAESFPMPSQIPDKNPPQRSALMEQGLALFARMQEDAARLHRLFLESQEASQRTLLALLEGRAPSAMLMPLAAVATSPMAAPAPVALPQQPTPRVAGVESALPYLVPARAIIVPAPAPVVIAVPPPPVSTPLADNDILARLREIVADKTGYPVEALDADLAMDADLGIDSIKRVEILAAVQDRLPGARVVGPDQAGSLRTLRELAVYLADGASLSPVSAIIPAPALGITTSPNPDTNTSSKTEILARLREIVADKTGYPVEALDADLAMDADLGIDSIKRVEILAAVQDRLPGARVVGPDQAGSLRTLRELAEYLGGTVVTPAPMAIPSEAAAPAPAPVVRAGPVALGSRQMDLYAVRVSALTYPREPLRLAQGARVLLVAPENESVPGLAEALANRHGWVVETRRLEEIPNPGAGLSGLVLVPGSSARQDGGGMIASWLKACAGSLLSAAATGGALLAGVGRLDGAWGRGAASATWAPEQAAVLGAVKTAAWEWPEVCVRAVDLARDDRSGWQHLADELGFYGPLEVGVSPIGVVELGLERVSEGAPGEPILGKESVILAVGGARGVTAAGVLALAGQTGAPVGLIGRTPLEEPVWATGSPDDTSLIRACVATTGCTLRQAQEQAQRVLASREARAMLEELRRVGSRCCYRSADAADAGALRKAVRSIRAELGPIHALVHGAGVLADARIDQLDPAQCARVFEPKAGALGVLLDELAADPLRVVAIYGSSTGRFGRAGQLPYAMANATLAAWAARLRHDRPGIRAFCFDWGPFNGGMVTPGLASLFASEGVGLIEPSSGGEMLARVSACHSHLEIETELVVLAHGSALPVPVRSAGSHPAPPPHPAVAVVADLPGAGDPDADTASRDTAFERLVSVASHPCLEDHVLDGKAVLPLALGMEWMAHAAASGQPGLEIAELADIAVMQGLQLGLGLERRVLAVTSLPVRVDDRVEEAVELLGADDRRPLFRARVRLGRRDPSPRSRHIEARDGGELATGQLSGEAWEPGYGSSLFHGSSWQALEQVRFQGDDRLVALVRGCLAPASMMRSPLRGHWLLDPWAVDGLFQVMILAAQRAGHPGCLPTRISQLRLFGRFDPAGSRLLVHLLRTGPHIMVADAEWEDPSGRVVAQARGVECVIDASLGRAFRKNRILVTGGT